MALQRSVGPGQANLSSDVLQVQRLLNARARASVVAENGRFDAATAGALSRFQERELQHFPPSGRIEPGSETWAALGGEAGPLDEAILAFEADAVAFAARFIQDARVRANYVREAQRFSAELRDQVARGALSVEKAAEQAVAMRNGLLDAARLQNSDIGRAVSEAEKAAGKTFAELVEHYANKLFGRGFKQLTPAQQDQVYAELVRAAGRPNPRFTSLARNLGRVGRGLLIVSLAYATYTVATSDRPGREAVRQGVGIGAGIGGSMLGGAVAGLACGPGAPVCVGVGALIGGIAFAVGVDLTFDWLWEMNALPGFELRARDGEGQHGELMDPSGQPRAALDGAVLHAVYQLGDGYLVVSADGDAFEECLHLTLCDSAFAPREVIHLGGAYQTGRFRAHAVGPGPRLRFSFFSDEAWQLEILPAPRWRLRLPRPAVRHSPALRPGRLRLVREARA